MRQLLWAAAAVMAAVSSTAAGERSWYVSLEAGMSDTGIDGSYATPGGGLLGLPVLWDIDGSPDESITFLGAIGGHLTDDLHIEVEATRRSGDSLDADIGQTTVMLNVAYDLPVLDHLSITLGAGGGIDFITMDTPVVETSGSSFAYQAMVGLAYEVTKNTDITLTYRHFDTLDVDLFDSNQDGYASLSNVDDTTVSIGLRFGL